MTELKIAYCMAVNLILVRLDKKAINAALASPADILSALITAYSIGISGSPVANNINNKLVKADSTAPSMSMRITP